MLNNETNINLRHFTLNVVHAASNITNNTIVIEYFQTTWLVNDNELHGDEMMYKAWNGMKEDDKCMCIDIIKRVIFIKFINC